MVTYSSQYPVHADTARVDCKRVRVSRIEQHTFVPHALSSLKALWFTCAAGCGRVAAYLGVSSGSDSDELFVVSWNEERPEEELDETLVALQRHWWEPLFLLLHEEFTVHPAHVLHLQFVLCAQVPGPGERGSWAAADEAWPGCGGCR